MDEDTVRFDDAERADGAVQLDESAQVDDLTPDDEPAPPAPVATTDAPFDGVEVPHTADERVDEVLAGLLGLAKAPVADHVAIYDSVHRGLRDCLADLEPASPARASTGRIPPPVRR